MLVITEMGLHWSSFLWPRIFHLPDVYLLRYGFIPNDLWGHPGHRTSERHLSTLITELLGRPEVTDLHGVLLGHQHTEVEEENHDIIHSRTSVEETCGQ